MKKALILYATRTNQTTGIANAIAEGIRSSGIETEMVNISDFEKKGVNPQEYDVLLLGAPTYHGEIMQTMKTFLFALTKFDLSGKVGGAFGAFGWSGESPGRIYDTMKNVFHMNMVSGPLRIKSTSVAGGAKTAQDYGVEAAKKVQG